MKRALIPVVLSAALLVMPLWIGHAFENEANGENVAIVVSPSVVNIASQGTWVTVHADIDYSIVDGASVTLNGIPVVATFADSCGDLVAKFSLDDVKDIIEVGTATLTLSGTTDDGGTFSGTDIIKVIKVKR